MFKGFTWNVPNALTLFRLFCVLFCALPLVPIGTVSSGRLAFALWFFVLGAISDYFDGFFARRLNQSSEWGAYMDPLIDKVMIWALYGAFLLVPFLHIPWWLVAIIVLRDILVTRMRNSAAANGFAFRTSLLAKNKTAVQMIVGVFILCYIWLTLSVVEAHGIGNPERMWATVPMVKNIPFYLMAATALFTVLTLFDYLVSYLKNKKASA